MELKFSKYSGCGNDFILVDNRQSFFPVENRALIARLCDRIEGIGANGVILLENSAIANFKMRIFNADGGETEMCGNGIRCFKRFLDELNISKISLLIETMERKLIVEDSGNFVKVHMGMPCSIELDLNLHLEESCLLTHHIDTGVPHVVTFVEKVSEVDVIGLGKKMRFHSYFSPKGANANFAQVIGPSLLALRTYERGVENETLACGTGATAAAIVSALKFGLTPPIEVKTRSLQSLFVDFTIDAPKNVLEVTQTGPASLHFQGKIALTV